MSKLKKFWRAQVLLTPSESKALIGKAITQLDVVKNALNDGIIVVHKGTTNYFVIKELFPDMHDFIINDWACGINVPEGSTALRRQRANHKLQWIIRKGVLTEEDPDPFVIEEMGPNDVYIKGANYIDPQGRTGVAMYSPNGSLGRSLSFIWIKGINFIVPVGLEKLVISPEEIIIHEAAKEKVNMAMGNSIGLFPYGKAKTITEIEAIDILTNAKAFHIESGGIAGAEGAVTLAIKGTENQVINAFKLVKSIKGATLPENMGRRIKKIPDYIKKM